MESPLSLNLGSLSSWQRIGISCPIFRKSILFMKSLFYTFAYSLTLSLVLSGCGVGLCVTGTCSLTPSLLISGLEGLSIRKNDCYPASVSAVNAAGNVVAQVAVTAHLSASPGVALYSSLQGCQTYSVDDEKTAFYLTPQSPTATFYFRSDVAGGVSLSASTTSQAGLADSSVPLTVEFVPFDNAEGPNGAVDTVVQDSLGRTYLGGEFLNYNDTYVGRVARLDTNGALDSTFVPVGTGIQSKVTCLATQADGKLLVGGAFLSYSVTAMPRIVRLNSDGSLDDTFATSGAGINNEILSIAVQSDDKVLVGGWFSAYDGTQRRGVARLNTDGSLDATFAPTGSGLLGGNVFSIALQGDGKVLVGGQFTSYDGTSRPASARLNTDGSLDATFAATGSGLNSGIRSLAIQGDGKVVVGGYFISYNGTSRGRIARLNSDGSLDSTFAPGSGFNDLVYSVSIQTDGKVLVGGDFTSFNGTATPRLARLNSDGSLDSTFTQTGSGLSSRVASIFIQSSGKILVGGPPSYNGTVKPRVALLNLDGSIDNSFAPSATGVGLDNTVNALAIQSDRKVVAGGNFTSHSGVLVPRVARFKTDGSLDSTFTQMGTGPSDYVVTVALQGDGKVLLGGAFTTYSGTSLPSIARLNSDGSLDTSFAQVGAGLSSHVLSMAVQSDGKLLVGGLFTAYNGTSRPYVARLNSNGSLDPTFAQSGTGLGGAFPVVRTLGIQNDGKVLLGGGFTDYDGTSRPCIARLNSDGTLDTTFAPTGSGLNGFVFSLAIQSDGKVLVGGSFNSYNGTPTPYVVRLNSDGSLDTTFAPTGSGLDSAVHKLAIQNDGKVLVGGYFTSYNGTSKTSIARLNSDGSLDTTFSPTGAGFEGGSSPVTSLAIQSNGKVVVGGSFTSYEGKNTANFLARLTYIGALD